MSVNKVILLGHVGKDPEVKHINDTKVATFSLATTENYTNKAGEKVSNTTWHNIVAWRGLAEVIEKYIVKGTQLYLEGKIVNRSYDDKDGVKRYVTEIVADTIQMLGKKPEGSTQEQAQPKPSSGLQHNGATPSYNANDYQDVPQNNAPDDLPF
ncbi:single-stranded DNA-binding protein [bacterium]|nr:single-stranded DNA-binding protein [bacterium]